MTRKIPHFLWFCPVFAIIFFSCTASPKVKETPPSPPAIGTKIETIVDENPPIGIEHEIEQEAPQIAAILPESTVPEVIPPEAEAEILAWRKKLLSPQVPIRPEIPAVPELIMGKGIITPEAMSAFLLAANPDAEKEFVDDLASFYMEESAAEGVNHDTAFAQMCLETGFLSFSGLVSPDQYNFCGLGAIGPDQPGEFFPDPRTGVRAHIQHLKAYATDTPLKQDLVDPRYYFVRFGSSPAIRGLSGTWAADTSYAEKIANILERLYSFAYGI